MMDNARYRSWVEVSRGRISRNLRAVREVVGPDVEVMPVVKADAYKHGAVEVSRVLVEAGARWLAVSSVGEGIELRDAGIRSRLLVMAGVLDSEWETLIAAELTPVLHSVREIGVLNEWAKRAGKPLAYHLKFDTGLGRLGTHQVCDRLCEAINSAGNAVLEGLMTHFASPSDFSTSQTEEQEQRFESLRKGLAARGIDPPCRHLASTNAIAYGRSRSWPTMVRPGLGIYGYVSPPRGRAPASVLVVEPALEWKAAVIDVKEVPRGATIGYGAIFTAPEPMRIAILGAGYADGYPHQLTNRGKVILQGRLVPVLGAVSMDLITVDATQCAGLSPGDTATLLGGQGDSRVSATDIAQATGTIAYSVLCNIGPRVKRVYVD